VDIGRHSYHSGETRRETSARSRDGGCHCPRSLVASAVPSLAHGLQGQARLAARVRSSEPRAARLDFGGTETPMSVITFPGASIRPPSPGTRPNAPQALRKSAPSDARAAAGRRAVSARAWASSAKIVRHRDLRARAFQWRAAWWSPIVSRTTRAPESLLQSQSTYASRWIEYQLAAPVSWRPRRSCTCLPVSVTQVRPVT